MQGVIGSHVRPGEFLALGRHQHHAAHRFLNDVDETGVLEEGESGVLGFKTLLGVHEDVGVQAARGAARVLIGGTIDERRSFRIPVQGGMADEVFGFVFVDGFGHDGRACVRLLQRLKGGIVAQFAGELERQRGGHGGEQQRQDQRDGYELFHEVSSLSSCCREREMAR